MGPLLPRLKRLFLAFGTLVSMLLAAPLAHAQTPTPLLQPDKVPFDFYERGPYRPDVPRPAALLGYEPGEFHTTYANYERFLRELAPKTDRLRVFTLAQTPEHRPLYLLAVSTPENLARLDAIKADLARLADPRACSDADAAAIAARSPMVVWLSYSIHGDESSAFEAGMQVLYQLTASDDPKITEVLRQCVVLINPAQNPDGHERFTAWYNAQGLGRPERFAFEHHQPWGIYGRFNHYLFDLNRDLLPGSQIESRAQMAAFLAWHPQVNADHHGETKNFFFPPPAVPVNAALPHDETEKWQSLLGQGNAAAFNRYSWLYYSRDVFDLYYPGYWDSWPSLHGSTGMTFESDGGGKRGFNWKRDDGTIETLREAIAKHFTASLATLETSAAHREDRLRDYHKFFATALTEGTAGKDGLRQVALSPGADPGRASELVANLLRQGIEVRRTTEKMTLNNAHAYLAGPGSPAAAHDFPPGSYLIDLAQPQGRVARTLLGPDAPLDAAFVKRQNDRQARNLEARAQRAARKTRVLRYHLLVPAAGVRGGCRLHLGRSRRLAGRRIRRPGGPGPRHPFQSAHARRSGAHGRPRRRAAHRQSRDRLSLDARRRKVLIVWRSSCCRKVITWLPLPNRSAPVAAITRAARFWHGSSAIPPACTSRSRH